MCLNPCVIHWVVNNQYVCSSWWLLRNNNHCVVNKFIKSANFLVRHRNYVRFNSSVIVILPLTGWFSQVAEDIRELNFRPFSQIICPFFNKIRTRIQSYQSYLLNVSIPVNGLQWVIVWHVRLALISKFEISALTVLRVRGKCPAPNCDAMPTVSMDFYLETQVFKTYHCNDVLNFFFCS